MLDRLRKVLGLDKNQDPYPNQEYEVKSLGNIIVPEKLCDTNAFMLANSVSEIFFPIDFYADRISKLRRFIADKNNQEIPNTELNRFIKDINPLYSFSDLVYQYIFSLLGDGNAYNYLGVPSSYKNISANNISRWDVLNPSLTSIWEYSNISTLELIRREDAIQRAEYSESYRLKNLDLNRLFINNYNLNKRSASLILSKSPLFSANKSIDVLLSVYSARYNVYANNGAAGYLVRKGNTSPNMSLEMIMADKTKREEIMADINERNGLTGKRNIWGISGIPLEFVKTIASISELMPLDETLENSIKIASTFQIPPELVPRKDQSTFSNKDTSEKSVWENGLLSMDKTVNENLTKLFMLDKLGYHIESDYSDVPALQINETSQEDLNAKKLANLEKIKQLNPTANIDNEITKILDSYGN